MRRTPDPRWALALVVGTLLACVRREVTVVRIRLPLSDANRTTTLACAADCEAKHASRPPDQVACLLACDGAERTEDVACADGPPDTPPFAVCYTHRTELSVPTEETNEVVARVGLALFEAAVQASVEAATRDDDDATPSRTPAAPTRKQTPASPKRR